MIMEDSFLKKKKKKGVYVGGSYRLMCGLFDQQHLAKHSTD